MSEDIARKRFGKALESHLDNWAQAKLSDPEKWLKEWSEAKEWIKSLTKKQTPR